MVNKEVKFGEPKKDIFWWVKVGVLLNGALDLASYIPGYSRERAFNLIDTVQQKLKLDSLNSYIVKDPELVNYRVKRIVDAAIKENGS